MKRWILGLLLLLSLNVGAQEKISLQDLVFKNLDNQPVTLRQYQGKPLYVKTWASWCPICLAGLAELDQLSAEKNKVFNIVTVVSPGHNNEKETQKFIEWYRGLDYKNITVLLDESGELIKRAKVKGYPSSLIVDEQLFLQQTIAGHMSAEQIQAQFK